MEMHELRDFLLSLPGVSEETPFGPEALVYKIGGKAFAILSDMSGTTGVNLKSDPADAIELRAQYPAIHPGYHMNKKHWNTVDLDGSLPKELVMDMVKKSYALVIAGMSKKQREELENNE